MNLRRLNYILIPRSTERVDAFVHSRAGRLLQGLLALTPEGQLLAVATLVSAAAGIDVRFSHLYLVFCGLIGLLIAALICRPFARIRHLDLRVMHPPRVAVGETITFTVVLHNTGPTDLWALRVYGPFLPWDGTWIENRPGVAHLAPGQEVHLTLRAHFIERGERYLGRFSAASIRPLGLMRGNTVYTDPARIIVVPAIITLAGPPPPAAAVPAAGHRHARGAGESFELLGVRPYRTGDRIRDLHARSSARLGEPMVREYREARHRRVRIALHGAMPRPRRDAFDAAASLTASIAARAARGETRVELLTIIAEPAQITLGHGAAAFDRALDLLAIAEPGPLPPAIDREAEARIGAGLVPGEIVWLIFADYGETQSALVAALHARLPTLRPILVSDDRTATRAAAADGLRTLRPAEIRDGLALDAPDPAENNR